MGRSNEQTSLSSRSSESVVQQSNGMLDASLTSLFASSSGPVRFPAKRNELPKTQPRTHHVLDEIKTDETNSSDAVSDVAPLLQIAGVQVEEGRPRKRRRVQDNDLENTYFSRLAKEEEREHRQRQTETTKGHGDVDVDITSSDEFSQEEQSPEKLSEIGTDVPRHETLETSSRDDTVERATQTVFLSNVSTEAITSKKAKRTLINHLESVLLPTNDTKANAKVESIRFRSTAYSAGVGPKRAAFAKKELMDETTKSTNAYVVFTTEWAAKKVADRLNGSMILDRHLRVDHLSNPSKTDHKRCVFVGNLSFVDQASTEQDGEDGQAKTRIPRAKEPADAEEGLWRTFSKCGTVENVRVVRDKDTRVGKGFGYVQFSDQNGVEAALLLNEKKFPPLLPRKLRVMRAKQTKNHFQTPHKMTRPGALSKGDRNGDRGLSRTSRKLVFEGHRASRMPASKDAKQKLRKRKSGGKPTTRSSRRGQAFKASGGKKRRNVA